jgi:flagellar export protein FliJ
MKAFRFSLQSVRVIRERKEQVSQIAYADALRAHEAALERWQRASDALALGWEALCQQLSAGATATELRRARSWCSTLEARQNESAAELRRAKDALDTASRALMNAARDRQALDRLHDKCRRAYDRDAQREEQKRLDELGLRLNAGGLLRGLPAAHGN